MPGLLLQLLLLPLKYLLVGRPVLLPVENHAATLVDGVRNLRQRIVSALRAGDYLIEVLLHHLPASVAHLDIPLEAEYLVPV